MGLGGFFRLGIRSVRIWACGVLLVVGGVVWGCEEFEEVCDFHEDPLVGGVGGAFAFGDDDACVGVVVGGFGVGFFDPLGGL